MEELDARKQAILQAVIVEYIGGAEPVGSEMLVQKYGFGVKSATIRNELYEMSERGFLEQPHTSSGRIPSDLGYRYYVDRLVVPQPPAEAVKQKLGAGSDGAAALQAVLLDTAKSLSRLTHLLTVASIFSNTNLTVRNALVSALGPNQAMLVIVLSNGQVVNRIFEVPENLTFEDIAVANEILQSNVAGTPMRQISKVKTQVGDGPAAKLMATIWSNLKSLARDQTRGTLITAGEEFMFAQPEFQRDVSLLMDFLDSLSDSETIYEAVTSSVDGPQTVTIGRENKSRRLYKFSVVRHSFFVGPNEAGVIAIVGPTRMRYDVGIPLVTYTARALTDSLTRFFG